MTNKEGEISLEQNVPYSENKLREVDKSMNSENCNKDYFCSSFLFWSKKPTSSFYPPLHGSESTGFQ